MCRYLILGLDTTKRLLSPKYYDDADSALSELFSLAHVISVDRDGCSRNDLQSLFLSKFQDHIHFASMPSDSLSSTSSTKVRNAISNRDLGTARTLIDESILDYCIHHKLYAPSPDENADASSQ